MKTNYTLNLTHAQPLCCHTFAPFDVVVRDRRYVSLRCVASVCLNTRQRPGRNEPNWVGALVRITHNEYGKFLLLCSGDQGIKSGSLLFGATHLIYILVYDFN